MTRHWTEEALAIMNMAYYQAHKNDMVKKKTLVSNCCGAENRMFGYECDVDYMDLGICPRCKDHCVFITEEELEQ